MRKALLISILLFLAIAVVYVWYRNDYTAAYIFPKQVTSKPLPVVFVFPAMQGDAATITQEMIGEDAIVVRFTQPNSTAPTFSATLQKAEHQIETELAKLREHYNIDTTKIVCCGFSLGGDVVFALALRHVVPITHVLIMGSRCTYRLPKVQQTVKQTRFAFLIGENDERMQQHRDAINYLTTNNCQVSKEKVPGIAHQIPNKEYIRKAFDSLLEHDTALVVVPTSISKP
ncbi:MAG: dienelactone hydrolase family protein [Candidatus Kapabacteria bacterium]|nr:dienelactone hydrolase family protein [Candidatus Kapabacteria bacterium]